MTGTKQVEARSEGLDGATLILMLQGFWAGEKRGFIEVCSSIDLRHGGRAWRSESADLYLNLLTTRGLLLIRRDKDGEIDSIKPSKLGRDLIRALDGLVFKSAEFGQGSFCPSVVAGTQSLLDQFLIGSSQKKGRKAMTGSGHVKQLKASRDSMDAEAYRLKQAEELINNFKPRGKSLPR